MSYIEELDKIEIILKEGKDLNLAQRLILIEHLSKRRDLNQPSGDLFVAFFEDVVDQTIKFEFVKVLDSNSYEMASNEAKVCFALCPKFKDLSPTNSIFAWISGAIKYTDQIALHYLQEVCNIQPTKQENYGLERSRYVQINNKNNMAQAAGLIMNNLYDQRNQLEHRTIKDPHKPERQRIIAPNYKKALTQIHNKYPKALTIFEKAFLAYYK